MSMNTGEATASAYGEVGDMRFGDPANFRSLEDVEAAIGLHGPDVEAVITELGGSTVRLASLDDWQSFRESCGLHLSDAALRFLVRTAGE